MIRTKRNDTPTASRLQGERSPLIAINRSPDLFSLRAGRIARREALVNARATIVNLRRAIASAVSHAPVKEVAREFGISPREVNTLRTETGFPRVPIFLEIARRDPQLRAQVMAILSGDGEAGSAESVNALVTAAMGR